MYADKVEAAQSKSVRDRINGNSSDNSSRRRLITGKRQRQEDDKWEHDLYEDSEPRLANRKAGVRDLRMKLQRKSLQSVSQSRGVLPSGGRDLREKLSGRLSLRGVDTVQPKPKLPESAKQTVQSVAVEASVPETKNNSNPKRKTQKKESVDSFLRTLDLEKYSITFQVEEVDMTALLHMTDEDLKALGIPMGPRKKILLALEPRR